MPIYEFKCDKCEKITSVIQKISEATSEVTCGYCGEVAKKTLNGSATFSYGGVSFSSSSDKRRRY